ncbi:hypothetical protein STEG23_024764, partial [Scotinomys teguina]
MNHCDLHFTSHLNSEDKGALAKPVEAVRTNHKRYDEICHHWGDKESGFPRAQTTLSKLYHYYNSDLNTKMEAKVGAGEAACYTVMKPGVSISALQKKPWIFHVARSQLQGGQSQEDPNSLLSSMLVKKKFLLTPHPPCCLASDNLFYILRTTALEST